MALKYVQSNTLYLSGSGVIIGATTASLTNLTDIYGNVLTISDFGAKGYITFEPDTTNEEAATFTGIVANTNGTYSLTGLQTALAKSPYTETSGLVRNHAGGTKVVITDSAAFWNTFANKSNDEIITGTWVFNNAPSSLSATPASTTVLGNVKLTVAPSKSLGTATITIASPAVITVSNHGLIAGDTVQFTSTGALPTGLVGSTSYFVIAAGLATNTFEVSSTAGGVAINTTGSQSGVHTAFKVTPIAVTSNDPNIFPNAYAADTGSANTYVITLPTAPASLIAGQMYAFLSANANSGASTLNINSLGAKSVLRSTGSALQAGDIASGQTIVVMYDGTAFRLDGAAPASTKFGGTGADGALTVTSGTTTINLGNAALFVANYTSISITGTGNIAFSNPNVTGTTIVLKSQGGVTITSSATRPIDGRGMGASGGATAGVGGSTASAYVFQTAQPAGVGAPSTTGGAGGAAYTFPNFYFSSASQLYSRAIQLVPGCGGGAGSTSASGGFSGTGGAGGAALLIECGGAWNFTTGIDVSGSDGAAGSSGAGSGRGGGGGGGGGAGMCVVLYNSLSANSGTITNAGGAGGAGGAGSSASGGSGGAGGAGSFNFAGGAGAAVSGNGGGGAGLGAAGGGGGGSATGTPTTGGASGGSIGGVVALNNVFV